MVVTRTVDRWTKSSSALSKPRSVTGRIMMTKWTGCTITSGAPPPRSSRRCTTANILCVSARFFHHDRDFCRAAEITSAAGFDVDDALPDEEAPASLFETFCFVAPRINATCDLFAVKRDNMPPPLQPCVHEALRNYWLDRILCVKQYHDLMSFVKGVFGLFESDSERKRAALQSLLLAMGISSLRTFSEHPLLKTAEARREFMGILSDSTKFTTTVGSQRWLDSGAAAVLAPHGKRVAAAWQAVVTESAASEAMLGKLWSGHAARLNATPKKRAAPDDVDPGPGGQGQQAKRPAGCEPDRLEVLSDDEAAGAFLGLGLGFRV